jgi:hypothetical protein
MNECRIEITPTDGFLNLRVTAPGLPEAGKNVKRPLPIVAADALDELRGGVPTPAVVLDVTQKLSEWLGAADLDLPLILGLHSPDEKRFRLVYSVQQVDDQMLRANLTDLPFELIAPLANLDSPYALNSHISSVVHLLPKVSSPPATAGLRTWPLRVLIVRANPQELQQFGNVPPAAAIRESIRQHNDGLGPDLLRIDVLSSEDAPDLAGPPTKDALLEQIAAGYDILVYLGHGDLRQSHADQFPVGVLQLETSDGLHADSLDAPRLSTLLLDNPVPVVLLVGCLTAANGLSAEQQQELAAEIPIWMRGSRAVAQALIDGHSGVQFVVGMRFRIEVDDASRFLKAFFKSLLPPKQAVAGSLTVGDLECAVRKARSDLNVAGKQELSWAAPIIFRTLGSEPMFPFLSSPPVCPVLPQESIRPDLWGALAMIAWSSHPPGADSLHVRILDTLKKTEKELIDGHTTLNRSLILPKLVEVAPETMKPAPEQTTVSVPIELHGGLSVHALDGTVTVLGAETLRVLPLGDASTAALKASGYKLLTEPPRANSVAFEVRRVADGAGPLPLGPLFAVDVAIDATTQRVYTILLENLKTTPPQTVCAGSNAIIVPPA